MGAVVTPQASPMAGSGAFAADGGGWSLGGDDVVARGIPSHASTILERFDNPEPARGEQQRRLMTAADGVSLTRDSLA